MKVVLTWEDGHMQRESNVVAYSQYWQGDEWLVTLEYRDGSFNQYTGREPIRASIEEADEGGEEA